MNLKNKTILVIGGAGFIGSHFIEKILEKESCRINPKGKRKDNKK